MAQQHPDHSPRARRHRRIKRLTVSAMLAALGVVILGFGALLEVLELTVVGLAALLLVPVVIEYGRGYPWGMFLATAILALCLLPTKSTAFSYLIFGAYPILKAYLERLPRLPCRILKEIVFLATVAALILSWNFLVSMEDAPLWYNLVLFAIGFATMHMFDLLLTRLIRAYLVRYRARVKKWMN